MVEKISVAPAHKLSLWVCLQMRVNRTLTALVAASLVGSAQAYRCTSNAQCKYQGCSNGYCVSGTKPQKHHIHARVVHAWLPCIDVCACARGGWNGEERGGTRARVLRACVCALLPCIDLY